MSNLRHALSDSQLENAKDSVQSLLTRVDELLEANAARADKTAHGVAERVKSQAHGLRRMARSRNVKRIAARTDRLVHRNAWKSIGLAVVVGVAAGALSAATALRR
ncbi:glycine zipper domain-containing protein [Bordetella genomosp. 13]|uniref:glycine zipper domain-containing protein n=1 Tax=Bordetella genomosp. 13 TaxID=463040 RepID=UPI001642EE90|nr:DUF883 family protein [Bordetella genomosp. 13]